MSQDKKYREFWIHGNYAYTTPTYETNIHTHVIEIAALDELKAQVKDLNAELNDYQRVIMKYRDQINQLTAALRDMVGALEFYANQAVIPRDHWETEFLWDDDLGLKARESLAKHADLIGKLK